MSDDKKQEVFPDVSELPMLIFKKLMRIYYSKMFKELKSSPDLLREFTAFLLNPDQVRIYLGRTHLGIEYFGPLRTTEIQDQFHWNFVVSDYAKEDCNLLEKILGFEFNSTSGVSLPLIPVTENLFLPTNKGSSKLLELGWNFSAQGGIVGFNSDCPHPQQGHFHRIIDSYFFDSDSQGLKTRHVQWLDLIPIEYSDDETVDSFGFDLSMYDELAKYDLSYCYLIPEGYRDEKLPQINRFIELVGNKETTEPEITKFLSMDKNKFILTMFCQCVDIHPEVLCEWNNGEERDNIKPDFFIQQADGFSNILEFKLPWLKGGAVVGKENRESASSEINSYVSQVRTYVNYFDDRANRLWLKENKGIIVDRPKATIIVGRRMDFSNEEWRDIVHSYRDVDIKSYDDLIDTVMCQFYL